MTTSAEQSSPLARLRLLAVSGPEAGLQGSTVVKCVADRIGPVVVEFPPALWAHLSACLTSAPGRGCAHPEHTAAGLSIAFRSALREAAAFPGRPAGEIALDHGLDPAVFAPLAAQRRAIRGRVGRPPGVLGRKTKPLISPDLPPQVRSALQAAVDLGDRPFPVGPQGSDAIRAHCDRHGCTYLAFMAHWPNVRCRSWKLRQGKETAS